MSTPAPPQRHSLFTALRYSQFRLYWMGLMAQITGQQMMIVTMGWLAYALTGSPLTLGIINLVGALPRIILTLVGGALADRLDQRMLIGISQGASTLILMGLAVLTFTGLVEVWHLAAAAILIGFAHSFDEPARQALFPKLLPDRSLIPAAVPLISMAWSATRIVAPAVAGFVIVWVGASGSFFLSGAGAAVMMIVIGLVRTGPIARETSHNMLRNIVDGARYAWGHPVFRVVIAMSFVNAMFGMGYTFMLPVFQHVFGVDADALGLMYAVTGVGSVLGLVSYHRLSRGAAPGKVMLTGVIGFGLLLMAFAVNPFFPAALAILFFIGVTHTYYQTSSQVLLQTLVPDHLRGRVMGLHGMLWSLMPVGGAVLNATAEFTGARIALFAGASIVLLFVLLVCMPNAALRHVRLDSGEDTAGRPTDATTRTAI